MSFSLSTGNTVYASASASITSNGDTSATIKVTASAYITNGWVQSTGVVAIITINGSTSTKTVFGNGTRYDASDGTKSVSYSVSVAKGTSAKSVSWSVQFWQYTDGTKQTKKQTNSGTTSVSAMTSYKIQYNANGGTGEPSVQTKWYGTALTLSSTKPTRTGYSFSKWNTASGGTGTNYNSGASYTANAAATLYAQWTPNTYTVTYNANGGSGAPGNQTKTHDQTLKLSTTIPSRMNYNFLGWATSASATTATYSAGGNYTDESAVTLYAVWERAYTPPTIWDMKVDRCLQNGTLDPEGTYYKLSFSWACDDTVDGNEVEGITVEMKETTSTAYINPVPISASGTTGSVDDKVLGGSCSAEKSYDILVTVVDKIDDSTAKVTLPTAKFIIDILAGGKGVAMGKAASLEDTFEVDFDTKLCRDLDVAGATKLTGGITPVDIPANSDLNDYTKTGFYRCFLTADAQTIANVPSQQAFSLEVTENNGAKQVFTTYQTSHFLTYVRQEYNGTWGSWRRLPYYGDVPMLKDKIALSSGGDLNSIRTPGTYACNDAVAASLSNCPVTTGFTMNVEQSYGSNDYISQNIFVSPDGIEYHRRYNANVTNSWSAWRKNQFYVGSGDSKVLATTGSYMNASQTITLSEKVSDQPNGIVLMWSRYSSGALNDGWSAFFIPKAMISLHGGCYRLHCSAMSPWWNMVKVVTVQDTQIIGFAVNEGSQTNSPVTWNASNFILRYVMGV